MYDVKIQQQLEIAIWTVLAARISAVNFLLVCFSIISWLTKRVEKKPTVASKSSSQSSAASTTDKVVDVFICTYLVYFWILMIFLVIFYYLSQAEFIFKGNQSQCYRASLAITVLPTTWWRGVVGNVFQLKRSYSTPGPVSTAMGDCLRVGKPSRCEACQLGRLSLLPSVGR